MRKRKVTLRQVADLAGVSQATVSMILNQKQGQSFAEETVTRVKLAAQTLGYATVETGEAEGAVSSSKKSIALFLPDITGSYYASIAYAIDFAAHAKGLDTVHFVCYRDKERELRCLSLMTAHNIAGVIFSYIPHNYELVEKMAAALPTVVIGNRDTHLLHLDTIETDSYRSGALLARHMLDLGHRHVAFIAPRMEWRGYSSAQRIQGVEDTFAGEGPDACLLVKTEVISDGIDLQTDMKRSRQQLGYTLTEECLRDAPSVTGFIAVNDYVAYGVIDALHAHGFRVPDDFSVCGSDDVFASGLSSINLTTVNHHIREKSARAFDLLYAKIVRLPASEAQDASKSYTRIEYLSSLVVRGSTAPPRARRET